MSDDKDDALDRVKQLPERMRESTSRVADRLTGTGQALQERVEGAAERVTGEQMPGPSTDGRAQHVVPDGKGWALRAENAEKITRRFSTKEAALERGREVAKNQGSYLVVHRSNGTVQEVHNYNAGDTG